jgi:hypothetical protein
MACPSCRTAVDQPKAIGFFGGSKQQPDTNLDAHPYRLVEKKRCPACATRFARRTPRQTCAACSHELFADADFARKYADRVGRRLPLVLLVSFLFSLIPVVGLIPGVIYYRLTLIAPYRRYIPLSRSFVLKWVIRIFFFVLIAFQWVPGLGGFVVPVMALVSYVSYRGTFHRMLTSQV